MTAFHTLLHLWETFFTVVGTAGATLAGLSFVAVGHIFTLVSAKDLPAFRKYSSYALEMFSFCLVLACLPLMPVLNPPVFSVVLALAGGWILLRLSSFSSALLRGTELASWDLSNWWWFAVSPILSGLLLLVAGGLGLTSHWSFALSTAGTALLLMLATRIRNTWDLVGTSLSLRNEPVTGEHPD